ncbi:hypothetical protein C0J52_16762 [Blattella germanica]|nr:hypothetical protein C0J52_16762 [Blattella germanica]
MGEYVICNSGSSKRNQFGVGFLIHKSLKSSILHFDPINERLCTLRMKGKFCNTSIICTHVPTEEKEEHIKDQYYDELTRAFNKLNKYDRKIVMGDLNAKLGNNGQYRPNVGQYSIHNEENDNGNMLADFAITNNLAVSSTLFPHKTIHKITWQSPDGVTRNQIDHVLIDSRHTRDISDVKTCRGADFDSDHFLIRIKFKPRISGAKRNTNQIRQKWDVAKFNNPGVVHSFRDEMRKILEERPVGDNDVEIEWKQIKEGI